MNTAQPEQVPAPAVPTGLGGKVRFGYIPGKPSLTGRAVRAPVEYFTPEPAQVPDLAKICFRAFGKLHDARGVARDFPNLAAAEKVLGLLVSRPDLFGIAARIEGKPVGSNFLTEMDEVGGIGPITVDTSVQGRGIGRGLMERVLDRAHQRGVEQLRLVQESFNTVSLTLYSNLGFEVREPLGCMEIVPVMKPNSECRPATQDDLPAIDALCRKVFRVSRKGELGAWISVGFPVFVRERQGKLMAYYMPGKLGHGVGETPEELVVLMGEAARRLLPEPTTCLCPLRHTELYRAALQAGQKLTKVLTYMSFGEYVAPEGAWAPSYLY